MIYDCMEVFVKELKQNNCNSSETSTETKLERESKMLIDNYVPKEGTYILINMDKDNYIEEPLNILTDKKSGEIIGRTDTKYNYIRYLDYNSKLIAMNKPIADKKVHSNNFYTFFVRKDCILRGELTTEVVDGYYNTLKNINQKYTKSKSKELYQMVENIIGEVDVTVIDKICQWVKNWLRDTSILNIDLTGKDYLKLFFVYDDKLKTKQLYENENQRYVIPKIYNKNDYNRKIGNKIYGTPNNNICLNSKKPFLEHKTRKIQSPYLVNLNDVMLQTQFFDYLCGKACIGNVNIYVDFDKEKILAFSDTDKNTSNIDTGMYLRIKKGKEVEILEWDSVINYNPNLIPNFIYKRILVNEGDVQEYGVCTQLYQLEHIVNEVFFSKMLLHNYHTDVLELNISDGELQNIIITYRNRIFEWFHKNPKTQVWLWLEKMGMRILRNSIKNGYFKKTIQQLNLIWSLQDYMENTNKEEYIEMIQMEFKKHIDMYSEEWDFINDDEYYYAIGQMVFYMMNLSKASKKPLAMANPILMAKSNGMLKEKLVMMYKKYSHALDMSNIRAQNIISHVLMYEPSTEVNEQYTIAGFTAHNVFYDKKQTNE